ncbi:MAG: class I SAM-dependent methyltransferase [Chloroflexota bacterium]
MHEELINRLCCPTCHADLSWEITSYDAHQIIAAEATYHTCGNCYPVKDGLGIFLHPDLPIRDLWAQVDSGLLQYLRAHPSLERGLMDSPLDSLAPTDQFFRALVLEARGDYQTAREIEFQANQGIYCQEYRSCWENQSNFVLQQLTSHTGLIVELASGRGYLAERILHQLNRDVVITDFSLQVLRGGSKRLEALGLAKQASFLACDARRMPFKDGAIPTLVTNLGLPNIKNPGEMLSDLHRALAGAFFAISHFYSPDDQENAQMISELGLSTFSYRHSSLDEYSRSGWQMTVANSEPGTALPTPPGKILRGAKIDSLPIVETCLEWCTLISHGTSPQNQ